MARLLVTIDTEEDEWGRYDAPRYGARNIARIPALQDLFDSLGVIPTYLVSYQVAADPGAVGILREIAASGRCEIGAHCHPWNTPPFRWPRDERHSMLSNLPLEAQSEKIRALRDLLGERFGTPLMSFRAGRCGFDESVASVLLDLGFTVDTSVTPLMSWVRYGGPDFGEPYPELFRLDLGGNGSGLLEVPATVGFLQRDPARAFRLLSTIRGSRWLRSLRTHGILERMGILNHIWLCPEKTSLDRMIALTRVMLANGSGIFNLMFHSGSLAAGFTPFVRTERERQRLVERIRSYLEFCRDAGMEPVRLGELPAVAAGGAPVRPLHLKDDLVPRPG